MRVAIDLQATAGQPTGFGRYLSQIYRALKKVAPGDVELVQINWVKKNLRTPARLIWDQVGLPFAAAWKRPDVLFVPAFSTPILWPGKMVVACHDLIGRLFPENFSRTARLYWHDILPKALKFADQVITISNSSKKDIVRLLKIPESKVNVTPLAADPIFQPNQSEASKTRIKRSYNLPRPFCLAVGTIEPRKNLPFLVEAFARAKRNDHDLVIVGKRGWDAENLEMHIRKLHLQDRVKILAYVPETDLPVLYASATALLFPSLYEGFGLPILEAMACGTPVVASTASSIPEVVGEAGLYADPKDLNAWQEQISRIITDSVLQSKLRVEGLNRARGYTWEKTALRTLEIFYKVAKL
ncbi:glycosyltransferase family 1 protein [Candidatus Parcubacteria bacterium]|jgi:glycosyltransferase involved in cell wall biosynthesis|nr:MAG: glycosyltransferase family 1 protein [Candidatus Parcubacteria bacterium]